MAKSAPQLLQMPTTSDERTNGDGISLCSDVKAATQNMNAVSVYPTSAMIPGMENDKFKIVLSDAIVGAGGKLLNADGNQFVNELETAQARADAMLFGSKWRARTWGRGFSDQGVNSIMDIMATQEPWWKVSVGP
eukprot:Skav209075  [mRNA]  locus=scaffold207:49209:53227:- [translate_table: standard]